MKEESKTRRELFFNDSETNIIKKFETYEKSLLWKKSENYQKNLLCIQDIADRLLGYMKGHQASFGPEITDEKLILRDNMLPYVKGRHVLLLSATSTTGLTAKSALDGIRYYGGEPVGLATVFGGNFEIPDVPVVKIVSTEDLNDYRSYSPAECPLCKKGVKIDALVNSYGYSKIV